MYLQLRTTTAPATAPITVALARKHVRIDHIYDDDLLAIYINTATTLAESYLNRALINRNLSLTVARSAPTQVPMTYVPVVYPLEMDAALRLGNNRYIELLRSPVSNVASVVAGYWGQADQTLTVGTDYDVDTFTDPARVRLYGSAYYDLNSDHITVNYTAGYGATPDLIPTPVIHAIMLMTGAAYEHRGDADEHIMSAASRALLDPYRLVTYA